MTSPYTVTLADSISTDPDAPPGTVTVTVAQKEAGITAALAAYNAQIAAGEIPGVTEPLANEAAYVNFVMGMAAESYARSYGLVPAPAKQS